eukprot:TRINITY_DN459_c0_g2_i1.p1 TRINITY_DN459_c0_g2~~TRINITY_DN459_c0_g2_i1.p1  ORF type:complete len:112 (-),score=34.12 TRINITY_DN459_c0_g2_i1:78-413(-)
MGQNPSEEDLFQMISEVDEDGSGSIEFSEFLQVIETQKAQSDGVEDELDTVAAFMAMGGNEDKSGTISSQKLIKVIHDFELTIDIESLIAETDTDNSGYIDYDEFKALLSD